ncbi:MAG: FAD-dependent oxidoreductase [Mariniphaga sp.]|nr:FAD-dependent oxidoreductase [Mariniphaga sp.]
MIDYFHKTKIPLLAEVDVLVIGAGSSGCIAALAAVKNSSHSVMLVERYGFPGGSSTQMLDTFYGFFTPGSSPKKIVGGIPDLVVNELDKTNDIFLRSNTYGAGTGVNYNPERLKLVWDTLITETGVKYLLHTSLVDVISEENERGSCIFWNKSGFSKVIARRVIDASGDADYCALSGYQFEMAGENEPAQSMTTTFRMCNVDQVKFEKAGGNKMMKERMTDAFENKTHLLPRKEGSAHEMCQPGCISTVAAKVSDFNALKVDQLTKAEVEGRKQTFEYERFFRDKIPGYEDSKIIGLSHQIGVRETRRVYGEHRLTKEDCLYGKITDTSVLLCGAPIEDHRKGADGQDETYWEYIPGSGIYGVPYGTIVPKNSSMTWVVGRCFSATHDAHASCRSMAQTMSMGQAAGLAAIQSLNKDCNAIDINISLLKDELVALGQILEIPDKIANTNRTGWKNNLSSIK